MKETLRQKLEWTQKELKIFQGESNRHFAEFQEMKKRVAEIAENESLRQDKKWLQQMHSAVLQTMMSRKSI